MVKMRLTSLFTGISLAVGLLVLPVEAAPEVSEGCHPTADGYVCYYGPYDIAAGEDLELTELVPPVPEEGHITDARATLVGSDGDRIPTHMVHLHHVVWANLTAENLTCPEAPFDIFFASGKERTPMHLPNGYGYYWSNADHPYTDGPEWGMSAHLDEMHGEAQENIYIKLKLGFTPGDPTAMTPIRPVWMNATGPCNPDVEFTVPSRETGGDTEISDTFRMPVRGRFIGMAGHLHDGGIHITLTNRTRERRIFRSKAVYGDRLHPWSLTKMTSYYALPGRWVGKGDRLRLKARYSPKRKWKDAMAIMMGALVEK